jgi:flagellar biosynthesis activator protein FlaF
MQYAAANAYAQAAKFAQPPRELEATLLLKAAFKFQNLIDDWSKAATELAPALTYNGRIWSILATSATEPTNPLPPAIKQGIAQLAVVIFQRTYDVTEDPAPEKLGLLVRINRDIAAGLRGQG